jgi:hypothetical protein
VGYISLLQLPRATRFKSAAKVTAADQSKRVLQSKQVPKGKRVPEGKRIPEGKRVAQSKKVPQSKRVSQRKRVPHINKDNLAALSTSTTDVVHASATTADVCPKTISNSASI